MIPYKQQKQGVYRLNLIRHQPLANISITSLMNWFMAIFVMMGSFLSYPLLALDGSSNFFYNKYQPMPTFVVKLPPQAFEAGNSKILYHAETQKVRFIAATPGTSISQPPGLSLSASPETAARHFLSVYGSSLGITNPTTELQLMRHKLTSNGRFIERFQHVYQGVPVIGGELIVQMDIAKNVISVNGEVSPALTLNTTPTIAPEVAIQTALAEMAKIYQTDANQLSASVPKLWIYDSALLDVPGVPFRTLVWHLEVNHFMEPIREFVLIDAHFGSMVLNFNQIHTALERKIYDNQNDSTIELPGSNLARSEGDPITDIADVDQAYDFLGDTYDFYFDEHGRDSIDDNGMTIIATVRYCYSSCPLKNAYWNGTQMLYGDGLTTADDIAAHEFTHGVTQNESHLFYYYQSGAINESFSDLWGEFVDQTNGKGSDTDSDKWKIGEDISEDIVADGIRDMKNPLDFNDPDKMSSANYYCGSFDKGGVHTNSGVNNKAVYLMTEGDTFNGKTVTGLGISKVADLYYEVQTNLLTSGANYTDLYDALLQACTNLEYSNTDCTQVKNALDATEMNQPTCIIPPTPLCDVGEKPNNLFFDDFEAGSDKWAINSIIAGDPDPSWFIPQTTTTVDNFKFPYAASGSGNIFGYNQKNISDTNVSMKTDVSLPSSSLMHFNHAYEFEKFGNKNYDGGVLEYSTDGGTSWTDAGSLLSHNGYNGTIKNGKNPLKKREAFVGLSQGYTSSRLDLSSLNGQNVRFRFRIGTDNMGSSKGWFIDDVRIYTCVSDVIPPTITTFSPINGASDIAIETDFILTFSENVEIGTGNIVIYKISDNNVVENIDVTSTQVSGSGTNTITIAPATFAYSTEYYVLIDNTAFKDMAGNPYAGISTTAWNFTTIADTSAPLFQNATPTLTQISYKGFDVIIQLDEPGIVYYVVVADGAPVPTALEVKAGTGSGGTTAVTFGNVAMGSAHTNISTTINSLAEKTAYNFYVVAEDNESTPNLQAAPVQRNVNTFNAVPDIDISTTPNINSTDGQILNIANMSAGTLNWTLQKGCGTPVAWMSLAPMNGSTPGFSQDNVTISFDSTGLSPGIYTSSICINSNDADEATANVSVTLTVYAFDVIITQSSGSTSVTEGGTTDSYDVVLDTQPSHNVTITITPDSQTTVDKETLAFTDVNWDIPQTVTVMAVDDSTVENSHSSTINLSASSDDSNYDGTTFVVDGMEASSLSVTITDNDSAAAPTPTPATTSAPSSPSLPSTMTVSVKYNGNGFGKVTSSPVGIDCHNDNAPCEHTFDTGTFVTLTPVANVGSEFISISGDSDCYLDRIFLTSNVTCTSNFKLEYRTLSIYGVEHGTVSSSPSGILCGTNNCSFEFDFGETINLSVMPDDKWTLEDWEGDCEQDGSITLLNHAQCQPKMTLAPATVDDLSIEGVKDDGSIDFGESYVDTPITKTLIFTNIAQVTMPLDLALSEGFSFSGEFQGNLVAVEGEDIELQIQLAAGESVELQIQLDALVVGDYKGNLYFNVNDTPVTYPLSGTVIEKAADSSEIPILSDPTTDDQITIALSDPTTDEQTTTAPSLPPTDDQITTPVPSLLPTSTSSGGWYSCHDVITLNFNCNGGGRPLTDLEEIEEDGQVINATIVTEVINHGWLSNVTIGAEGIVSGGIATGSIKVEGYFEDFEFRGASVSGLNEAGEIQGMLGSTISNNSKVGGSIQDVFLAPDTSITGGILREIIIGDPLYPALLEDLTVVSGNYLDNVIIDPQVEIAENVTLGAGVEFVLPGVAIDKDGKMINSQTGFLSLMRTENQRHANGVKLTTVQVEELQIEEQLFVETKHVGQSAEILIVAYHKTATKTTIYMRVGESWKRWNGEIARLEAATQYEALAERMTIPIFEGDLSGLPGDFTVYSGYRLETEQSIVFNGESPLEFSVEK